MTQLKGLYKPSASTITSIGICIYGRGGTGKTTLAGTMPGKGLVIDVPQIEGGTFVLEDKADHIDIVPVEEWNEVDDIYWFLHGKNGSKPNHDYKWVAIDSITAFQELAKRRTIAERTLDADPRITSQQDYLKMSNYMSELIYRFRTLPIHSIWTAQERSFGDEGQPKTLGPAVQPAALTALMPSMMLVGRLAVFQDEDGRWTRNFRVGPHPDYYTKLRARPGKNEMPYLVKNPDLGVILRYLLGNGPPPESAVESGLVILE